MPAFLIPLLGFGWSNLKRDMGLAWGWVTHASFWQLAFMAMAAWMVVVQFKWADAKHDLASYRDHAAKLQQKLNTANAKLSAEIRKRTDEENRRIAGDADTLRLSGPGRARCPASAARASGHEPTSGNPDAPRPEVPPADSAAVPWGWLVNRAEQSDLNRAEVLAWREWYQRLLAQWPKTTEASGK